MNIRWNQVTWYSSALAVILYVATFLVGLSLGSQLTKEMELDEQASVRGNLTNHYVNKEFGIEFDTHPLAGDIVQMGHKLEGDLTGFIEKYEVKQGGNIRNAITELVWQSIGEKRFNDPAYSYSTTCGLNYVPWLPNEVNNTAKGQIAINVFPLKGYEYYDKLAEAKAREIFGDEEPGLEFYAFFDEYLAEDCSGFSLYGYFLYDPIAAPDRFYFVYSRKDGGEPWFYQPGTVRVLPD